MKPLSDNIKRARKASGLTQEQAARKLSNLRREEVSRSRYAKYEEGINPPWDMMPVIMKAFGIKEQDMYPFIYNEEFFKK